RCRVKAIPDQYETVAIHWSVVTQYGHGVGGIPVLVWNSEVPCVKYTDADGYVVFSVRRPLEQCNDSDASTENDFYAVALMQPDDRYCTFTSQRLEKFRVCPKNGDVWGSATATCAPPHKPPFGHGVTYELSTKGLSSGAGAAGVRFYLSAGGEAIANAQTDGTGTWLFSPANYGLDQQTTFTVIPTHPNYVILPQEITLKPNSCTNNRCRFLGIGDPNGQGILR